MGGMNLGGGTGSRTPRSKRFYPSPTGSMTNLTGPTAADQMQQQQGMQAMGGMMNQQQAFPPQPGMQPGMQQGMQPGMPPQQQPFAPGQQPGMPMQNMQNRYPPGQSPPNFQGQMPQQPGMQGMQQMQQMQGIQGMQQMHGIQGMQNMQGMQPHPSQQQQQQQRSRIDPNQIPSPIVVQENDQNQYESTPFLTSSKTMPPLASTHYTAIDDGNCNPRFMRLTTYSLPLSEELANMAQLPMGLIVTPLADLASGENPVPVVDFGENGPVRCRRCKAYINPFMVFTDGGRTFICNLCGQDNEVPSEYFCNLDMSGRRIDLEQRPELRHGTVEFVATKEYFNRPAKPAS
ncbi:COPII coat Sec23p-Sfb3p heterodimer component, partial [Quaeritorhiza haematococci]